MRLLLVLFLGLTMTNLSDAQQQQSADVIFINGNIYLQVNGKINVSVMTGAVAPIKTTAPVHAATAIAVANGKILSLGTNAEIEKLRGPNTQVIDLGGHFVMPGFNDAHTHLASGGFEKLNVD